VVKVVSPHDPSADVAENVAYYLAHGVVLAWAAYPAPRQVVVHRADRAPQRLSLADTSDGEEVLPGFRLPLAEILD
jgi:Uma2 family endonuclease